MALLDMQDLFGCDPRSLETLMGGYPSL